MARLTTLLAALFLLAAPHVLAGGDWGGVQTAPSESECRPYIEKALKELGTPESQEEIEGSSADQTAIPTDTTEPAKEIEISNDQADNLVPESKEEAKPEQETLVEINVSEASITANETGEGITAENGEPAPSSDSAESTENLDKVVSESVELPSTSEELPEAKVESGETSIEESAESNTRGIPETEPLDKVVEASETDSSSSQRGFLNLTPLFVTFSVVVDSFIINMQNDAGEAVDLYCPRKCSASNRIIHATDHASIHIDIVDVDPVKGTATETSKMYAICGSVRRMGESDDCINRLAKADKILPKNF